MTWLIEFFYWLPAIIGAAFIVIFWGLDKALDEPETSPPPQPSSLITWRCQPPASHFFQGSTTCECQQIRHGGENR